MLNLLERSTTEVIVDLHNQMLYGEIEMSIKSRRMMGEDMKSLENRCRTELTGLQMELDQLLNELSQFLESNRA